MPALKLWQDSLWELKSTLSLSKAVRAKFTYCTVNRRPSSSLNRGRWGGEFILLEAASSSCTALTGQRSPKGKGYKYRNSPCGFPDFGLLIWIKMLSDLSSTSLILRVDEGSKEVLDGDTSSPILAVAKKDKENRVHREICKNLCQLDLFISSRKIASRGMDIWRRKFGFFCMFSRFFAPLKMTLTVLSERKGGAGRPLIR